jgi:hypothetical protein
LSATSASKEAARPSRVVEDERARVLDLAHRQLPAVAGGSVSARERGRDQRRPAVEEGLHVAGAEAVADRLQPPRLAAAGTAVAQCPERDAGARRLPLRPLVPVQPHLGRVREVGADLDEAGTELRVEQVEVVDADPSLLLLEREVDSARPLRTVAGAEHPPDLLRRDDRDHPEPAVALRALQVGPHMLELAVVPAAAVRLAQPQDRDRVRRGERSHLTTEAIASLCEQRRRGNRLAQVRRQELHHLPAHLQAPHIRIQAQSIDALDLERHMPLEHLVDVRHAHHPRSLTRKGRLCRPDLTPQAGRGPWGGPALPTLTSRG